MEQAAEPVSGKTKSKRKPLPGLEAGIEKKVCRVLIHTVGSNAEFVLIRGVVLLPDMLLICASVPWGAEA